MLDLLRYLDIQDPKTQVIIIPTTMLLDLGAAESLLDKSGFCLFDPAKTTHRGKTGATGTDRLRLWASRLPLTEVPDPPVESSLNCFHDYFWQGTARGDNFLRRAFAFLEQSEASEVMRIRMMAHEVRMDHQELARMLLTYPSGGPEYPILSDGTVSKKINVSAPEHVHHPQRRVCYTEHPDPSTTRSHYVMKG